VGFVMDKVNWGRFSLSASVLACPLFFHQMFNLSRPSFGLGTMSHLWRNYQEGERKNMCKETQLPAIVAILVVVFSNSVAGLHYLGWVQWLYLVPHFECETCISGSENGMFCSRSGRKLRVVCSLL
jgi:hypothetical protein